MSHGRIQILINATVRDVRCHKQCTHFQDIAKDQFCCMAFNYHLLGRAINGDPLRLPQCIAAEKRAKKLTKAAP